MPILQNARHEVYCQHRAIGENKAQAARAAGYSEKSACVQACHFEKKPEVQQRIRELSDRASEHAVASIALTKAAVALSKEWVLGELQELYAIAKDKHMLTPAARSLELIGKELGMFQDVIPREMYNLMMAAMGQAVTRYVQDASVLESIIGEWERISIAEPRQLKAGILPRSGPDSADPE